MLLGAVQPAAQHDLDVQALGVAGGDVRGVRRIVFGPAAIRYTPIGPSRSAHIRAQNRSVASVPMCSG